MKKPINKLNRNYYFTVFVTLIINVLNAQTNSEFNTIIDSIETSYMKRSDSVGWVVDEFISGGTFENVNYNDKDGYTSKESYSSHLKQTYFLAQTYKLNPIDSIRTAYFEAMDYFIKNEEDLDSIVNNSGDWHLRIGLPRLVSYSHFLMHDLTYTYDLDLFRDIDDYIIEAFNKRKLRYGHASDVVQCIEPLFAFYVLKKDENKIDTLMTEFSKQLQFAKKWEIWETETNRNRNSGIETDYSFTAHNDFDRQIYNGNYGRVFIENVSKLFYFTHNTSIQLDNYYNIFSNFLVDGNQWTFYKKTYDNGVLGRNNGNHLSKVEFKNILSSAFENYLSINPPRSTEIDKILQRIQQGNTETNFLKGNKYFWRSDMMIHRNKNYHFSVRMTSNRTVAPETDGTNTNFYAGAGVTYLMKNGDEYRDDYYNKFDIKKFPGITAEQNDTKIDIAPFNLPTSNWGKDGSNDNEFAGGVSDGNIGVCGMIWQEYKEDDDEKKGIKAHKSWFMFEDEIVALGSGVTQINNATKKVITTLNQSKISASVNTVWYKTSVSNNKIELLGNETLTNNQLEWFFHDNVGYFPISSNDEFEISKDSNDLFYIGINHGVNPTNRKYAYLIKPDINISEVENNTNYTQHIKILENTKKVQAIYNTSDDVFQAVFYETDSIIIPDWDYTTIKVKEPSLIMIKRNLNTLNDTYDDTFTFVVSNPKGEKSTIRYKEITFKKDYTRLRLNSNGPEYNYDRADDISIISVDQGENILSFDAWNSRWGGQSSRIKEFGRECSVVAASSNDGNLPYNTRDNSLFSRWSAQGLGEYIQYRLCDTQENIDFVDIAFYRGELRHANFKISVSTDENAQNFEDVTFNSETIIQSSGTTNDKQRFYLDSLQQNIKYIRYTGYGNDESSRESWNSVTEFDWGKSVFSKQQQKESLESTFSISPNPVTNNITIFSDKSISKISLYSIEGKTINTFGNLDSKEIELNLSKYSTGIYIIKILYKNGEYTSEKIIKE